MPAQPSESTKCEKDIDNKRQGLGRAENEGEMASGSEICMFERRESRTKAVENAEIKQGKGSEQSSSKASGGSRS